MRKSRRWIGAGIAALGILFLAAGAMQEQFRGVFFKAIMICYECIGIG